MIKSNGRNLSAFYGLQFDYVNKPEDKPYEFEDSPLYQVLSEIFSVDESTGLPKGDISYFLSPDGNPQVKQWLEMNLLQPRAKEKGTSLEGVTDDFIEEFSRERGESISSYALRLGGYFDAAKKEYEDSLKSKEE